MYHKFVLASSFFFFFFFFSLSLVIYLGCYSDDATTYTLSYPQGYTYDENTPAACSEVCLGVHPDYLFSGVEDGNGCHCSNVGPTPLRRVDERECGTRCPGDDTKFCGAENRINVYQKSE